MRQRAEDAFWEVVAQSYPEVQTGDFPPDSAFAWDEACKNAIASWLASNHPEHFKAVYEDDGGEPEAGPESL